MKRKIAVLTAVMAFTAGGFAQEIVRDTISRSVVFTAPDTIVRKDTIVVREVITRTDVVHRTETIVRHAEQPMGSSESVSSVRIVGDNATPSQATPSYSSENLYISERISEDGNDNVVVDTLMFPRPEGNGNYIWIPDSLEQSVRDLLAGKMMTLKEARNSDEENFDPAERVIFRGDTIPMVLKSRNLGRYDRGLFNFLFIPKGIWQLGITASYGEFSTEDLQILDLVSDVDFFGKVFSVRPYFSYFFRNNLSVGLRLGYTYGRARIGSFKMEIDEDMSFNLHDILYRSQNYSASLTFSQYLGIARKGRFGIFNEVELAMSGGNSDFHRPYNGEPRETHTTAIEAALNFSPGVCVYVLDQVSFNVSLGVFGLYLKHEKQKVNGEPLGDRTTSGANFRINLFNINFGIAVNI